jgi:hypothetical protein
MYFLKKYDAVPKEELSIPMACVAGADAMSCLVYAVKFATVVTNEDEDDDVLFKTKSVKISTIAK